MSLPPVQHSVIVPLTQSAAFDLFVRRLPKWWPLASRSVGASRAISCHVEVEVGGRLYEVGEDGAETIWGRFRVIEYPSRVVFSWHPGMPEAAATEVEVRFHSEGTTTRVELEHRDWERLGKHAEFMRGLFDGGWGPILERLVALSEGKEALPSVENMGCIDKFRALEQAEHEAAVPLERLAKEL